MPVPLSSLFPSGPFRPLSHGGRAVANAPCGTGFGVSSGGLARDWKQFPCWPPLRHAYLNEDAAGAVRVIKKAGLIKGGRPENADNTRTGQLAPEKGGQLRRRLKQWRGPEAQQESQGSVWRRSARWRGGGLSDPPQQV